jgi:hypothetical protein
LGIRCKLQLERRAEREAPETSEPPLMVCWAHFATVKCSGCEFVRCPAGVVAVMAMR